MTAPTLPIHVDIGSLDKLRALKLELQGLASLGAGAGAESPLKGLQRQMQSDVQAIKASLEELNGHFGDTAKAIAAKKLFKEVTKNAKDGGKDLDSTLGTVAEELKKRQKEFETIIRNGGTLTDKEMQQFMTGGARIYPDQRLSNKALKDNLAASKAFHKEYSSWLDGELANRFQASDERLTLRGKLEQQNLKNNLAASKAFHKEYSSWLDGELANRFQRQAEADARELSALKVHNLNMDRNSRFYAATPSSRARLVTVAAKDQFQGMAPDELSKRFGSDVIAAIPHLQAFRDAAAPIPKAVKDIGDAKAAASPKIKAFAADLNDAHAGARGLASGFGALWLTYGRVVPLLAGAAVSAGFVQTIKVGAQVQHTFEIIRNLSDESAKSVAGLNQQMLELARSGPFGPLEIANAMKTLSLAGLNAKEVSSSIRTVLQFAVAGDTTIQKSADVLSGVATAFGFTAAGYGKIADTIAKTAAISKSSVESMGEAFRSSSVLGSQYGASLQDVALGLALLSNVNIQGGAAGTQLRNMYSDLAGRTPKVRAALASLGFEFLDANGKAKGLVETFKFLSTALQDYDSKGRQRKTEDIFTERGNKPAQAGLQAVRRLGELELAALKDVSDKSQQIASENKLAYGQYLDEMAAKTNDTAGFVAIASAQMMLTPLNQMKSVKSALEATFVEVFDTLSPQLLTVAARLKDVFASEEFKNGLSRITLAVADAIVVFTRFGDVILTAGAAFLGFKAVQGVTGMLAGWAAAATLAASATTAAARASAGLAAAQGSAAAASAAASAAEAAGMTNKGKLLGYLGSTLNFVSKIAPWVTLLWGAWELYSFWTGKASDKAIDYGANSKLYIQALEEERKKIEETNKAKSLGLTLDDMKAIRAGNSALENLEKGLAVAEAAQKKAVQDSTLKKVTGFNRVIVASSSLPDAVVKANLAVESAKGAIEDHNLKVGEALRGIKAGRQLQDAQAAAEAAALLKAQKFGAKGPDPDKLPGGRVSTADTYATLLDAITDKTRAAEKELETSKALTKAMQLENDVRDKINDAAKKYDAVKKTGISPSQAGVLHDELNKAVEKTKELEAQRALNKGVKDATDDLNKYVESQDKEVESLQKLVTNQRIHNDQLGKTKDTAEAIEALELESRARRLRDQADEAGTEARLQTALQRQAGKLEDLARLKREGGLKAVQIQQAEEIAKAHEKAAKETADEWLKTVDKISDGLSNIFVDWISNGKSLMESFRDWMKDTFNNLVLRPTLEAVGKNVLSSLGLGNLGGSGGLVDRGLSGLSKLFGGAADSGNLAQQSFRASEIAGMGSFGTEAAGFGELYGFGEAAGAASATAPAIAAGATGFSAAMPYIGGAIAAYSIAKSLGIFGSDTEKEYAKGLRLSAGAGGVSGESYSKWSRAGGLFNPGSSGENRTALDTDQAKALSAAFGTLRTNAAAFADVLGLGSDSIKSFSKDIDIVLGSDQAANDKAIAAAMAGLGTDLAQLVLGTTTRTSKTVSVAGPDVWVGSAMDGSSYQTTLEKVVEEVTYTASEWARAGETANDTLTRLGGSLIAVNGAFDLLHHSLELTGMAGADAASKLVDAFGGIEAFGTKTAAYYDKFYSSEEKLANQRRTVNAELVRLTGGTVSTRSELRKLVEQQDLSTDSGRNMYANLINVSGAFDSMASASEQAASAMTSLTDSLFDEVRRIRGLIAGPGQQGYAYAQAQFAIKTAQARAGDQDALKLLPSLSQNLLELAASNVSTLLELRRIQSGTGASLTATGQALGGIPSFDVGTDFVPRDMLAYVHKGEKIVPASQNNDSAVVAEVRALRQEVASLLRQAVDNTKDTTDILQGATRGGLPLQTVAA